MHLQQAVNNVFVQLSETIRLLSPSQYIQQCGNLGNNTIGQHVRHVIELFQCLDAGYPESNVNYEKRKRDIAIETDKELALQLLQDIFGKLDKPDKELTSSQKQESLLPCWAKKKCAQATLHAVPEMSLCSR